MKSGFIFLMIFLLMIHFSGCTIHKTKQEIVDLKETIKVLNTILDNLQADTAKTNQTTEELESQLSNAKNDISAERDRIDKMNSGIQ